MRYRPPSGKCNYCKKEASYSIEQIVQNAWISVCRIHRIYYLSRRFKWWLNRRSGYRLERLSRWWIR